MGIFSKGKPARSEAPEFIEVGQIVNTHGVKGDVKVQPWDVTPAQLAGFKALYMDGTQFRPIDRRIQGDMVLMHFPGWDDMTAAETLKTKILSIKRSEVQLKKGEFLDAELIGMQVYEDFIHRYVGTVEEVLTYPAHKLYKVRATGEVLPDPRRAGYFHCGHRRGKARNICQDDRGVGNQCGLTFSPSFPTRWTR